MCTAYLPEYSLLEQALTMCLSIAIASSVNDPINSLFGRTLEMYHVVSISPAINRVAKIMTLVDPWALLAINTTTWLIRRT